MTPATEKLMRETLGGIYAADYRGWDDGLNNPEEFVRWAKSRALAALAALDAEDTAPPDRECSDKCVHWYQEGEKKPYRHLRSCRACNPYTLSKFMRRAEVEGRLK